MYLYELYGELNYIRMCVVSPTSDATRVFYVVIFPRRIGLSTGASV